MSDLGLPRAAGMWSHHTSTQAVWVPEVSRLAAQVLVHGVQRPHAPILLQPYPIREEILPWGFCGGSQKGAHHHYSPRNKRKPVRDAIKTGGELA